MSPRNEEKIVAGLRSLARRMEVENGPPAALEGRLLEVYRRRRSRVRAIRAIAWGGIAASLVLMVTAIQMNWRWTTAPVARIVERSTPATARIDVAPKRAPEVRVARRPSPAVQPAAQRVEVVTEFLTLDPGGPLEPLDRGGMISVRLPRSALMMFGLPMNEARASESVRAEVLVGEDGVARAIRFVQ